MAYTRFRARPSSADLRRMEFKEARKASEARRRGANAAIRRKWERYYIDLMQRKECVYCKRPFATRDHVPAPIWIERLGIEWFEARGIGLFLVDTCLRCNSTLGGYPLFTTRERRTFMQSPTYRRAILEDLKRPWRDYIADLD